MLHTPHSPPLHPLQNNNEDPSILKVLRQHLSTYQIDDCLPTRSTIVYLLDRQSSIYRVGNRRLEHLVDSILETPINSVLFRHLSQPNTASIKRIIARFGAIGQKPLSLPYG